MPIVSRGLSSVQPSAGGTVLVMERAIDDQGRVWIRGRRRVASEAQAIAEMDAYDWAPQLMDREELDAVKFVRAGNSPDSFARADLTASALSKRLTVRFMGQQLRDDQPFMLELADWLSGELVADVAAFMGTSEGRAQVMIDRATDLAGVRTTLDTDDDRTEKLG